MDKHVNTLVLGAGYVGQYLVQCLDDAVGTRRNKKKAEVHFDLNLPDTWENLPIADNVVITFPCTDLEMLQDFYDAYLCLVPNVIVYGSTSRYIIESEDQVVDEDTTFDNEIPRVQGEEFLFEEGANLLVLAGIFGYGRLPKHWLKKGLIKNGKKTLNLIHLEDIVAITKRLIETPQTELRLNLCNGEKLLWSEIAKIEGYDLPEAPLDKPNKSISNKKLTELLPDLEFKNYSK